MTVTPDEVLVELLSLRMETDEYSTIRYFDSEGKLHRIHGPAVIHDGACVCDSWWKHGQRHRDDGPAFVNGDHVEYYINGVRVSECWS